MRSATKPAKSIFTQLPTDGEEYISVKQYLSSCLLLKGKIEGVSILKIDNPELTSKFEKKTQKLMKLIGWSNMKNLNADNNELSLLGKRGFVFGKGTGGLDFVTGNINSIEPVHVTNKTHKSVVEVHEQEHTFLYSDLAVGRSFVRDKEWQTNSPPEGYDSFYMPSMSLDRNGDGEFDLFEYQQAASFDDRKPENYEHKYWIKDPSLVIPRYIIRFKFATNVQPIKTTVEDLGPHARHAALSTIDDADFFDPETHRPITMREKMKLGGARLIVPVEVAYEQSLADWQHEDPLIEGKREWLEGQLDSIDEKVRLVNLNYADVLEKIQESAEAATRHLQELTKIKLDTLLSVEVELRRQKEQMLWMDSLVDRNFASVSKKIQDAHSITSGGDDDSINGDSDTDKKPISHVDLHAAQRAVTDGQLEFLQIWKHHTNFRNAATRLKPRQHMDALAQIKADIAVKAELNVYVDQSISRSGVSGTNAPPTPAKDDETEAGCNGRAQIHATEGDKVALNETMLELKGYNNYSQPPRPTEDLLTHLLQSVVDIEAGRIQDILGEALQDDRVPMPPSLHRPAASGATYAPRGLLDMLVPPLPPGSANELVNHKELYYTSMKAAIGEKPSTAKDLKVKSKDTHHNHHHRTHEHRSGKGHGDKDKDRHGQSEAKNDHARAEEERKSKELAELEQQRLWQERELLRLRQEQEEQNEIHRQQLQRLQQQEVLQMYNHTPESPEHPQAPVMSILTDPQLKKGMTRLSVDNGSASAADEHSAALETKRYTGLSFEKDTLKTLAKKFRTGFSLTITASRRMAQMRTDSAREEAGDNIGRLANSSLLTPAEAQTLYYSLPFFAKPPTLQKLYSSCDKDYTGLGGNLAEMYTASMMNNSASLLLVQSGDFVFGAYLSQPLRVTNSGWTGSPACFIFSVTLDIKMPYHARNPPAGQDKKPVAFLAQRDKLTIGNGDIIIFNSGHGVSNIENCYGMGLTYGSSEAACFLAGTSEFIIDEMELWMVAA